MNLAKFLEHLFLQNTAGGCFCRFMIATLSNIIADILGALSDDIYVNASGTDQIHCGSVTRPCRSLSFIINNVSCHNDTIRLMASPIKPIRFTLKNPIIIKHSLTISKFPAYSQNPLITYDRNLASNQKEFYAFAIFRYALAPDILNLNIKSVNFNVNILTTLTGNISCFHLSLSISYSIISSPGHAVNFSDVSGYKNVAIQMKDLLIQNGVFMFKNIRERCQPREQIKNIIEMNNVTFCNAENIALSVHGCFNVSIEKLMCSNVTWKKQDFFTFTGGVLNAKNVLIKNILSKNNTKYSKSEAKALFLIYKSVGEIQNILIKDSVEMSSVRPNKFSAVIIVQNSIVKVFNMEMEGNSFGHFARSDKSSICVNNMTLSENNFTAMIYSAKESNVTLYEIKFYRNKAWGLLYIKQNSKLFITNNSLTGNEIFKSAYLISRSRMILNNTNFHGNKINILMVAKSQTHIFIHNLTLTNNHGSSRAIYNESTLNLTDKINIMYKENRLTKSNASSIVYDLSGNSTIQLNNVAFIQNKLVDTFLRIKSNSSAIIQNNTLTENNFSWIVFDIEDNSTMQLKNAIFAQNKLIRALLWLKSGCSAIIYNKTMTENKVSLAVYDIKENSIIQLNHVTFIRNKMMLLLRVKSNSSAIIQNNTFTENIVTVVVYQILHSSIIQQNHVTFIRNKMGRLLQVFFNSSVTIQNNILTQNNISDSVYDIYWSSIIQLNHVTFIRNKILWLLQVSSNCSVIIQNNILTENNFSGTVCDIKNNSTIHLNHVTFIRNSLREELLRIHSYSSAIVQNNTLTDNNILLTFCYIPGSSSIKLINNTMFGNSFEQMFVAQSSYLGIDKIFIENNTLSKLISAFECNVSFDSMKIKKNVVTSSMINVENSAERMTTTYIENSDNFMASAFTTTCTYLGNKYYPFETANTEILWSHALPASARPIIQLNGKVSLTNVKLLITSLFDTEILQYSTKDMLRLVNGNLKTFSNIYIISSLFISCTKASVKHIVKADTFRCIPCAQGTYSLKNESLNTSLSFQSKSATLRENTNFTCLDCPVGANCTVSIKSKSNFYGYETKGQKLKFLPCPRGICCTGNQCNAIKSCNKNRFGTLCARCIESYMESFLSTDCISIHSCQNFAKFWLLYCIYALILATFLYYMKGSITLIKTASSNFGRIFKSCKKEKENYVETDTMIGIDGAEEHKEKTSHFTMSGIFALIVSFYQKGS